MTLLTKEVEVKWHGRNRKHYESMGYKWTKQGDSFKIPVEHLSSGSDARINVRCDYCGEEYKPTWKDFLKGRKKIKKDSCSRCVGMKVNEIRISEGAKTVADDERLLNEWSSENNVDPRSVLACSGEKYIWKCSENEEHKWRASPHKRSYGRNCPFCAGKSEARFNRYNEPLSVTHAELAKEWSSLNSKKPDEITAGSVYRAKWVCSTCKHKWQATVLNRTSSRTNCPACNESKGEKLVAKILDELNVPYVREQSFPDLKGSGGGSLRYDFAILYDSDPIALIEYDGIQHFEAREYFGGEACLKRQQLHDQLKDDYARKRNVPLLRIRYDQSEEEVEKIVSEFAQIQKEYERVV